jgi:hypothetical protein
MNPDKNEWGVWKIAYKHSMTPSFIEMKKDAIEEQLKTSNYVEANAELSRIMKLK